MEEQEKDKNLEEEIKRFINSRSQSMSYALSSHIQRMFSGIDYPIKRHSLQAALHELSEESLLHEFKKQEIILQIPGKSAADPAITLEKHFVHDSQDELFTDDFIRKLPVSIQDKRLFRHSVVNFWKTEFIKLPDYVSNKYKDFLNWFDFWNDTFQTIEGRHGAAVLAYFLFIRFLLYMNVIIFLLNALFIIAPALLFSHSEIVNSMNYSFSNITINTLEKNHEVYSHHDNRLLHRTDHVDHSGENITANSSMVVIIHHCKGLYQRLFENDSSDNLLIVFQDLLQGTGNLEQTLLFTGFYPPVAVTPLGHEYNMPFAFLCILFLTFVISCILMIKYSSTGVQEAFLTQNTRSNFYSNEVFSCWDYCIKDRKTARLQHDRIYLELKTNLFEDRSELTMSKRSLTMLLEIYAVRLFINAFIIMWLSGSLYLIYVVVLKQMRLLKDENISKSGFGLFFIQYFPAITVACLNCISPVVFDFLVHYEKYSSQTLVNLSLVRNVFLYLASIIMLLNTVQSHVACKPKDICGVGLDETCHSPRCWETYVGQQLYKLTIVDMTIYFAVFICYDLVQYFIITNFDNAFTKYWGRPVFFLPTEVLSPVYSQTLLWLGVLYCPLLPCLMICKLIIIFYIKKIKILFLCDPAKETYRASKFNSVFILTLFVSFFFVVMVHSYALENIPPSRGCGPFRYLLTMSKAVPQSFRNSFSFLMSHWFITIAFIILCYAIHYYSRILVAQKKLVQRLKYHLVIQSYDKQFLLRSLPNAGNRKSKEIINRLKMRR